MDAIDVFNTVMEGIIRRLPVENPDLYERYLKKWHPEEYEAYIRLRGQAGG